MKKVKQVNGYIIKQYTPRDIYYTEQKEKDGKMYNVFRREFGRTIYLEADLTLEQAIEYCKEN